MLKIRSEQLLRLKQYMLKQYEDHMLERLRVRFPRECAKLGDEGVRDMIRAGIERSRSYGVDSEADVRRYIEWMVMLGPQFDTDLETSWMGEILRSKKLAGFEKMDLIDRRAAFARGSSAR